MLGLKKKAKAGAVVSALAAAVFYAIATPFSKLLLNHVAPTFMAAFLYLGAGLGVGILYIFHIKNEERSERLTRQDLPYTLGMIALDIAAPIFLMLGIKLGTAANASLLGNFEIAATALIALLVFKEPVSKKLWAAIGLITLSGAVLSFEDGGGLRLCVGSLFVMLATCCWGLENNCTGKISEKSTHEIVLLKGIFSGGGSFLIAWMCGEAMPEMHYIAAVMLLGFVAYGLSIFLYVRAQRSLGAAKTGAFYAAAPFIGSFLAFAVNGERPGAAYFIGLVLMLAGTVFVVSDIR